VKVRLVGRIADAEPRLPSRIAAGRLVLDRRGRERMTLDSGFTGSVAIPRVHGRVVIPLRARFLKEHGASDGTFGRTLTERSG
jgi:hypothetical protein